MKVAILGVGHLGAALARGLVGDDSVTLALCDRHPEKLAPFEGQAETCRHPLNAVTGADVVVLCVKPKGTLALAAQVAPATGPETLLVSCAAGVSVAGLPGAAARAMPNIGASVAASTTAFFLGPRSAGDRDRARVRHVFGALGAVREVPDEVWLHPVTAVGASGPAFILLAVEALVEAAVEQGLPRADALAYAAGAVRAAAGRLTDGVEPAALRREVTSPNGTTFAGLQVLERKDIVGAYIEAVRAAVARSRELANESG